MRVSAKIRFTVRLVKRQDARWTVAVKVAMRTRESAAAMMDLLVTDVNSNSRRAAVHARLLTAPARSSKRESLRVTAIKDGRGRIAILIRDVRHRTWHPTAAPAEEYVRKRSVFVKTATKENSVKRRVALKIARETGSAISRQERARVTSFSVTTIAARKYVVKRDLVVLMAFVLVLRNASVMMDIWVKPAK